MEKAYLILSDGQIYEGRRLGNSGTVQGEFGFTSAVVGYMETITDPQMQGKIAVQTFPVIGCYGAISEETGNRPPAISGYVVREACAAPSNFRMESTLAEYLERNGVIGISGIDVRALKRKARAAGALFGMIAPDKSGLDEKLKQIRAYAAKNGARVKAAKGGRS